MTTQDPSTTLRAQLTQARGHDRDEWARLTHELATREAVPGGIQVYPRVPADAVTARLPAPPMLRVGLTISPLPPEDRARLLQRYGKEPQARRRAWREAKVLARIVFAVLLVALLVGLLAGGSIG